MRATDLLGSYVQSVVKDLDKAVAIEEFLLYGETFVNQPIYQRWCLCW